ncbi:MAG: energy-coupling factor ABC transporter ATP-binding protein [Desulfobacter sp.]|nr:MAG: energy-coupling factor ABC transporter ATP-binding protein [Desulfobacter sp.]
MAAPLYQLTGVSHFYGHKKVLEIDRLDIPQGAILGLSGPNGSGKSTLLKLLAFAMSPTQGQIYFKGRPEHPMSPRVRSRVSLLTQRPYLLKRTVLDNVVYGLKIRKDKKELHRRAAEALDAVGLNFGEFKDRAWHQLSGGEAQRVAMAARLILHPRALLLDEPVASVDTQSAGLIRRASLAARDAWGCTLIIVSHDLIWLNECSDTRISMHKGRIFSTQKESIIPPPYTKKSGQTLKLTENDGYIILPPPTGDTAVIPQDSIRIAGTGDPGGDDNNRVNARIIEMILDKRNGNILTSFSMNGFSITLSLDRDQVARRSLQPGKEVVLTFNSSDINWR